MDFERGRYLSTLEAVRKPNWNTCMYCRGMKFKELHDFTRHLRMEHCTVEGGSFVCRYGYNSVCNSLPVEGVSDLDYADHIIKQHAFASINAENNHTRRKQSGSSEHSMTSENSDKSGGWMMVAASQNLAAVLNDPGRGKQRDFFTKLWGADFIEISLANIPLNSNLPLVTRAHFETFLRKISKRHRRHEEIQGQLPVAQQFPRQRRQTRYIQPLDILPIFIQSDFDLSRPSMFYTALPFAESGITVEGNFRQNSKALQERLAQSLDDVEMRIAEQVAEKSETFFAAMTSHDTLMDQLAKTLSLVRNLRGRLGALDQSLACQSLNVLKLQQRRANYKQVLQKLNIMRTLHQTQPQIQVLLSAPDYVAALELISTSSDILANDLSGVRSFKHLAPQLSEISRIIDKMMANEFKCYSTRDLNRPLTDNLDVLEQEKLVCIMLGMLRRSNIEFIDLYQKEALTTIKAALKQVASERLAESDCDTHGSLPESIRLLSLIDFLQLMDAATAYLARFLRKIKGVHDIMKDTLEMAAGVKNGTATDAFTFLEGTVLEKARVELQKLLLHVCSFADFECAKLMNVAELKSASASQLCGLGQVVERFSKDCMAISGGSPSALPVAFKNAASSFISSFHSKNKERLLTQLNGEKWRAADVSEAFQRFITSVTTDGSISNLPQVTSSRTVDYIIIGKDKFIVVNCGLEVVHLISAYAVKARELSMFAFQLLRNLVELLQLFNSRSCRLVLFAEAVSTTGLKTITTTNLVLASRTLQLIIWFLPRVQSHFEDVMAADLSKNNKISEMLDEIKNDMADQIEKLHDKVVVIGSSVVTNELNTWVAKPPVPSKAFRSIFRHLTKLHEAVSGVLPGKQIEEIYRKINELFKSALREQIRKLNIVNNGGPQHGNITSELVFYVENLKQLNVLPIEDLSRDSLDEIWQNKPN